MTQCPIPVDPMICVVSPKYTLGFAKTMSYFKLPKLVEIRLCLIFAHES